MCFKVIKDLILFDFKIKGDRVEYHIYDINEFKQIRLSEKFRYTRDGKPMMTDFLDMIMNIHGMGTNPPTLERFKRFLPLYFPCIFLKEDAETIDDLKLCAKEFGMRRFIEKNDSAINAICEMPKKEREAIPLK